MSFLVTRRPRRKMDDLRGLLEAVQRTQEDLKTQQQTILERLDALEVSRKTSCSEQSEVGGKVDRLGLVVWQLHRKVKQLHLPLDENNTADAVVIKDPRRRRSRAHRNLRTSRANPSPTRRTPDLGSPALLPVQGHHRRLPTSATQAFPVTRGVRGTSASGSYEPFAIECTEC